jgi:hypothetical protein
MLLYRNVKELYAVIVKEIKGKGRVYTSIYNPQPRDTYKTKHMGSKT